MNKKILAFALVLFAAFSSGAQIVVTSTQAYSSTVEKPKWQRSLGPFLRGEIGLHWFSDNTMNWSPNIALGYQFTQSVSLTVGAAYRDMEYMNYVGNYYRWRLKYVPLFVALRFNASKGSAQPFLDFKAHVPVYSSTDSYSNQEGRFLYKVVGVGFSVDFGLSIKYFNISAFWNGVPLQRDDINIYNGSVFSTHKYAQNEFGIKIGVDIPFIQKKTPTE